MQILSVMQLGGPLMWAIFGLSILAGAIIIERLVFFKKAWAEPEEVERKIAQAIYEGDRTRASELARSRDSSLHRLFRAAIDHWAADAEAIKVLLEQERRRELFRWERGLEMLSTIARVAPLLGLLGTVLGMVEVFRTISAGRGADMLYLASGIWEALLTTVAGLSVAIPVVLAYAYLSSRVDMVEETLSRGADFILREKLLRGEGHS
ncbi:MAG TPA: MotA/TolQ/ExbB proton channel family protein [Thermosynergistes sp.]|nr:MotA/TolQ/ExbB proton channel family protein [Thermosynergistes sp.]HPU78632.1 MotA/TolQ/ExbB proton channel family protein [Thermosynergistes sp.]HPZ76804.1 MotA/TolQ/ExbB proton channel family protein [Thermosynergistes sp.]HQE21410.1 MotA/TolQ/ExbB proton channel family protein [Thermosynergistes sp.]HXK88617.1 MotA/TolQ/ExbB proton channel family protein [Thermosynergistes sp.]